MSAVWYMLVTGDWDPHFYNYGTFYIYLVAVIGKIGSLIGLVPLPSGGWLQLHWIARTLTALTGGATIGLVYVLAKARRGLPLGLGAALLLAVLPAHVVNSHYATVDVPATFLLALFMVIVLRFFGHAQWAWYVLAGLTLGLAAATKYTAGIGVLALVAAHIYARDEEGYSPSMFLLIAALAVAAVAFLAVTPYLFVMTSQGFRVNPDFVRGVTFEMEHARAGGTFAFVGTGSGWVYHLLRSLPAGMGYIALAVSVVGCVLLIQRGGPVPLVLFSFAIPYFAFTGASKERFLRYMLPLLPVLAIAAAYAAERLRDAVTPRLGGMWAALAAGVPGAAVFGVTLWYAAQMTSIMAATDVRDQAANWLRPQLAHSGKIGLASDPWYFTPPITPYNGGLRSLAEFHRWQRENPPYRVIVIGWEAAALSRSKRERLDFFVVSDAEYADLLRLKRPDALALMAALPKRFPRRVDFEPPPPLPWLRPDKIACPPDWLYTWPLIEVYY